LDKAATRKRKIPSTAGTSQWVADAGASETVARLLLIELRLIMRIHFHPDSGIFQEVSS
jgi:hypothetical protein